MIEYPDVSHYNAPLSLRGAPLVFAKATQGTGYVDPTFGGFRAQARQLGIPLGGYHWLDTSDAVAQARHAFSMIGAGVPTMIDDEQPSIIVGHTLEFVAEYRRLGGTVRLEYLPRWTWEASGQPDLRPLAAAGLYLVASDYRPPDAPYPGGAGWSPYGGVIPTILQYTDRRIFNGRPVDFNRFPGTLPDLLKLIGGNVQTAQETSAGHIEAMVGAMFPEFRATLSRIETLLKGLQPPVITQHLVDQELSKALTTAAAAVTPPAPPAPSA